jgi:hypothetical protein
MSYPRVAALLALLASALYLGVARPATRERDVAREAYGRAREERERLRTRVAEMERRARREDEVPTDPAAGRRALRLALLRATQRLDVSAVQVAVTDGGRVRAAARGRLTAEGTFTDLVRLASRLAEPSGGPLLERVTLQRGPETLRLEVETSSAGDGR